MADLPQFAAKIAHSPRHLVAGVTQAAMLKETTSYKSVNFLKEARNRQNSLLVLLQALVELESPSDHKPSIDLCVDFTAQAAAALGARIRRHRSRTAGDILEARFDPSSARHSARPILLLGHLDTVWPLGTLVRMPFRIAKGRAWGPGVFDMKAGVAMALTALDIVRAHGLQACPVILLLVSDEETGSHASRALTEKIARRCQSVFVLEPAQGLEGAYKTARKGIANYRVQMTGVAAHSGVNFEQGHSAIAELARQIPRIEGLTNLRRGITVNVGTMQGGTRSNVVAAEASAEIDLRFPRSSDFPVLDRKLRNLRVQDKRCVIQVEGGMNRPPMERTPTTLALYRQARKAAAALGFELHEAATGGGSDGNFTSALGVPTLDGMGAVGEGAHALHESVVLRHLAPRTALLAALLSGRATVG